MNMLIWKRDFKCSHLSLLIVFIDTLFFSNFQFSSRLSFAKRFALSWLPCLSPTDISSLYLSFWFLPKFFPFPPLVVRPQFARSGSGLQSAWIYLQPGKVINYYASDVEFGFHFKGITCVFLPPSWGSWYDSLKIFTTYKVTNNKDARHQNGLVMLTMVTLYKIIFYEHDYDINHS